MCSGDSLAANAAVIIIRSLLIWIDHHAIVSLIYIALLSPPGVSNGVVILGPPVKIGLISTAVWITLNVVQCILNLIAIL